MRYGLCSVGKSESNLTKDVLYLGGLIHIIDTVLTMPLSGPATRTKAGLNDLIAILNKGGWLLDPVIANIGLYSTDLSSRVYRLLDGIQADRLRDSSLILPNMAPHGPVLMGYLRMT